MDTNHATEKLLSSPIESQRRQQKTDLTSPSDQDPYPLSGISADSPSQIPARGWWQIITRVVNQTGEDHVSLVAAGIAFYGFLAVFPALIALVSLYGLLTTPETVQANLSMLLEVLPEQAYDLVSEQLQQITSNSDEALGFRAAISILVALWSANKGTRAMFEGLNIAYNESTSRGWLITNLRSLVFTVFAAIMGIVTMMLIAGIAAFLETISWPKWLEFTISGIRWILLTGILLGSLTLIYRHGPSRREPKLRWVSVGAAFALLLWLGGSAGFSYYVGNFGGYDKTYGSLAAVVVFLLWMYLSALIVLIGAEINAETELQTGKDTTVSPDRPIGERGAFVADNVASAVEGERVRENSGAGRREPADN